MDNFYSQSFQEFASNVKTLDLTLYAGAGLIIWVLFQKQLIGLKDNLSNLLGKIKLPNNFNMVSNKSPNNDPFFQLVVSWKQTRDLAVQSGCLEAVKMADQMFPLLGPNICNRGSKEELV